MMNGPKIQGLPSTHSTQRGGVTDLAARALSVLKAQGGAIAPDYSSPQLQSICDAFVDHGEEARHQVITTLLTHGLSRNDIIEHIIPTTAHLLGERWFANQLSFADVTIGAARLQEAVRSLASKSKTPETLNGDSILLVVPRNEHHTLGVFVAAHQFRKLGIDVRIAVGQHPIQVVNLVKRHGFPVVGITASGKRSLASARDMVGLIKTNIPRVTRVVVGGSVTMTGLDIRGLTGADMIATDPSQVIEQCNLTVSGAREHVDV